MKKKWFKNLNLCQRWVLRLVSVWIIFIIAIAFYSREVMASRDLDRRYAFESIGYLRAWDNMGGLFGEYIREAYDDYFFKQGRFRVHDLDQANKILRHSNIPYEKLIQDKKILANIAKVTRVETLLRTKVLKENDRFKIVMEWMLSPKMEKISEQISFLDIPAQGRPMGKEFMQVAVSKALDRLIGKVPFLGHITGRDEDWVTINIGKSNRIEIGDQLTVATVEEVKMHPLLNSISDWRFKTTGKMVVEQVDRNIAFCRVVEEEPGIQVGRYQKITTQVQRVAKTDKVSELEFIDDVKKEKGEPPKQYSVEDYYVPPKMGVLSAGLSLGGLSRSFKNDAVDQTGTGLFYGAALDGMVFFNRNVFAELSFDYGLSDYDQEEKTTGKKIALASGHGGLNRVRFNLGYLYLANDRYWGPRGWAKVGYHSTKYNHPISAANYTGPATFSGLFLGIGGDLPIRLRWSVRMEVNLGVIRSVDATDYSPGDDSGTTDVHFNFGFHHRLTPQVGILIPLDVLANSADFINGAGGNANLSERVIRFAPRLLYYF